MASPATQDRDAPVHAKQPNELLLERLKDEYELRQVAGPRRVGGVSGTDTWACVQKQNYSEILIMGYVLKPIAIFFVFFVHVDVVHCADDFFNIINIKPIRKDPPGKEGIWRDGVDQKTKKKTSTFIPCFEVRVRTKEAIRSRSMTVRMYLFNRAGKKTAELAPGQAYRKGERYPFAVPQVFQAQQTVSLYFPIPEKMDDGSTVLVVFGDKYEIAARAYPDKPPRNFDFPQKAIYLKPAVGGFQREKVGESIIEHVVETRNQTQPRITLFLRFPGGATDAAKVKGVMAVCVLANGLGELRNMLHKVDEGNALGWQIRFAEKHQLALLVWGSRRLWNPSRNYDEMTRAQNRDLDQSFDAVATAWARGIRQLGDAYGLPQQGFLLAGTSGSAQWAARLALRKPEFFLAVHVHIPSSFDQPTPEGNRVLWCLTTGELEAGYDRSLRFFTDCRRLGYPMIYKAVIGLGHQGSPVADAIGLRFFEHALALAEARIAYDKANPLTQARSNSFAGRQQSVEPWTESFRRPLFVGDIVNQDAYPGDKTENVPPGFRVALPTKEIMEAWKRIK
jgi:pimeloyl-ACP methyl ester carboxylesterase